MAYPVLAFAPPHTGMQGLFSVHQHRDESTQVHRQQSALWQEAEGRTAAKNPSLALLAPGFPAAKQHPASISPLLALPKATGSLWQGYHGC